MANYLNTLNKKSDKSEKNNGDFIFAKSQSLGNIVYINYLELDINLEDSTYSK